MKPSDSHVGLPELRRVAEELRYGESLVEGAVGVLPHPAGLGDLPTKPPSLHQILRDRVRVARSKHSSACSRAWATSPRASASSPRLAKRWIE
jgi:hypothetical protein